MIKLKSGNRVLPDYLEYLFNKTRDLITQIKEMNLADIEISTLNESFVIYLYRLYEKQIKWSIRRYGYEDEPIKQYIGIKRKNLFVADYINFIQKLDSSIIFRNRDAIDEINNEFRILRNAIVHGEAQYSKKKVFEKLENDGNASMTGDGYFHPSTEYLLDILHKAKLIVLECEEVLYSLSQKSQLFNPPFTNVNR